MELSELKKEIHATIEIVEDARVLLEVAQILENRNSLPYEETEAFWEAIQKARTSIAEGKGISDKEARERVTAKQFAGK